MSASFWWGGGGGGGGGGGVIGCFYVCGSSSFFSFLFLSLSYIVCWFLAMHTNCTTFCYGRVLPAGYGCEYKL